MGQTRTAVVAIVAACAFATTAIAARVDNLYSAEVPLGRGSNALSGSFAAALAKVLVKLTGRRDVGAAGEVAARFGDASRFVQQYQIADDGTVWILFDEVALRRELDVIGEPVWGAERPTTLVWLALDEGFGQRRMLGDTAREESGEFPADADPAGTAILEELLAAADARGLPLTLPLADPAEMRAIPLGDVWGGYTDSLLDASRRYGADAILLGRARSAGFERVSVRWTLLLDDERFDWEGDLASGPNDVADFFAARLATSVGSSSQIVLNVDHVDSLDAYGRLSSYLMQLDLVQELAVDRVSGDRVVFRLQIRGDVDTLMRSIALRRVLQPVDDSVLPPPRDPFESRPGAQSLHYRLMAGQ